MSLSSVHPEPVEGLITKHLELWTSAVKRRSTAGRGSSNKVELYGIKKLRELILELAVRGLLVPQDPTDEPASELLKRIAAEKAKLVKEGKIKKDKLLPTVGDDEKLFPIQKGWQFVRLLPLSLEIGTGPFGSMIHQSDYVSGGIPLVNPSHMIGGRISEDAAVAVDREKANELSSYRLYAGDIVLARRGEVGRCALVTKRENGWLCGTGSFYLRLPLAISRRFMVLVFGASSTRGYLVGNAVGTTMVNLNHGILNNLPIALPPLNEQHRIVAKVDELMALCDQLEQQTDASLSAHQTLVETLLTALTSAADHQQFATAWQRIAEHFDTLFTTEESIDQLKQTILQLAVMGKLVPQDPNDEPASELLKKIAAEKAKLVKEGKVKEQKLTSPEPRAELSIEIPSGWRAVRLGDLAFVKGGKRLPAGHAFTSIETPYIYIRVTDMKNGTVNEEGLAYIDSETHAQISNYTISSDDLYITIAGTIGDVGVVPERFDGMNLTENAAKLVFRSLNKLWLRNTLMSAFSQDQFREKTNQLAQPKLALHRIESCLVLVPPLAEQHRIVAKVDELMALCDQLKARLSDAQGTQLNLADAIAEQALV